MNTLIVYLIEVVYINTTRPKVLCRSSSYELVRDRFRQIRRQPLREARMFKVEDGTRILLKTVEKSKRKDTYEQ